MWFQSPVARALSGVVRRQWLLGSRSAGAAARLGDRSRARFAARSAGVVGEPLERRMLLSVAAGEAISAEPAEAVAAVEIEPVIPDPRDRSVDEMRVFINDSSAALTLADLSLTRDSGGNLLTTSQTLWTVHGGTWVLGNLAPLTFVAGTYRLEVRREGVMVAEELFDVTATALEGSGWGEAMRLAVSGGQLEIYRDYGGEETLAGSVAIDSISSLTLYGGAGDDSWTVSSALPFSPVFVGGGGRDTVRLEAGAYEVGAELKGMALEVGTGVQVSAQSTLDVASLTIEGEGRVDLGVNSLIVRAAAGQGPAMLERITGYLRQSYGLAEPYWMGSGLGSGAAAQAEGMGLAVMLNAGADGAARLASFEGETVDADTVLVKYTWDGDADLSGWLDADDYFARDLGELRAMTGYSAGDFNYDGVVDGDDQDLLDRAYWVQNQLPAPLAAEPLAAVAGDDDLPRPPTVFSVATMREDGVLVLGGMAEILA